MALSVELRGSGPPLVLLHGFTQTARLWGSFGSELERAHTVVAVDLPGHGASAAARADLPGTAALVANAVRGAVGDVRCALLGYSLGARVGLHVALGTDLAVDSLVFVGVTAGLEDPAQRARRRAADEALAAALEGSGDVEEFVQRWLSGPMFARLADTGGADHGERLRNTARGLASSLRLCGTGTQEPCWDRLGTLRQPVLALAGTDDIRFGAHALRLARLVPSGVASLIPGGGHAAHLAQPVQTSRLVRHWLAAVQSG